MRSRVEIYWNKIETAPAGVAVQVRVTDGSSNDYLLPYPCKLTQDGWVNAATAIGGAPHLLEALRGNPPEEERVETQETSRRAIQRLMSDLISALWPVSWRVPARRDLERGP